MLAALPLSDIILILLGIAATVDGHGRLIDPPGRSTMWRYTDTNALIKPYKSIIKPNYQDNQLFCGGFQHQQSLGGKCGICGDPYDQTTPRQNEAGGKYGKGIIVAQYAIGTSITVQVEITAAHKGFFEFRLCPMNDPKMPVTKECLDKNLLTLNNGQTKYMMPPDATTYGIHRIVLKLPDNLDCSQCVLQWRYHTGNSWGCDDTGCCLGCGPQEEFYGCADIAIGPDMVTPPLPPPAPVDSTIKTTTGTNDHTTSPTNWPTPATKSTTITGAGDGQFKCKDGEYTKIYGDCYRYYWCIQGNPIVQYCSPGTVVSDDDAILCDHAYAVSPPCGTKV